MGKKLIGKVLVLGGSKGLGLSISKKYSNSLSCSRKSEISIDFSKPESVEKLVNLIDEVKPKIVFYVAGGGPHGDFFSKPMQSHQWAYQVNFFTPIALVYKLIEKNYKGDFVYIGSAIAERSMSTQSLSYSQSKKMAKQSLLSLSLEAPSIKVFSPPYMDTEMLTKKAWPRIEAPDLVIDPDIVASELVTWLGSFEGSNRDSAVRHFDWTQEFEYALPKGRGI